MSVTLEQLTPEARAALLGQLQAQQNESKKKQQEDRKAYKDLVDETIPELFNMLKAVSEQLSKAKQKTFDDLKSLIELKARVYGREEDQFTHSFTTSDGVTIVIGSRVTDTWDDTVTAGLSKINSYLNRLAKDKDSAMLIGIIRKLLQKDAKGNLKASRILQLKQEADKTGNEEFIDAIKIIMDAYKPKRGQEFVTVRWKDGEGKTVELPLDITSAGQ